MVRGDICLRGSDNFVFSDVIFQVGRDEDVIYSFAVFDCCFAGVGIGDFKGICQAGFEQGDRRVRVVGIGVEVTGEDDIIFECGEFFNVFDLVFADGFVSGAIEVSCKYVVNFAVERDFCIEAASWFF